MKAAGLIFSNIHDGCIPEITKLRTMASVPFGGRYRLVDFPLSNMVNSDITKVGIITHNNYQSLLDHIGTGKDWDLARRSGGIKILPPFITTFGGGSGNQLYSTRLEALVGVKNFVSRCDEDTIVLSDCNMVCNINFGDALRQHEKTGADLTVITKEMTMDPTDEDTTFTVTVDGDGRITDYTEWDHKANRVVVNTNMMIVSRTYLLGIIDEAIARGYTDLDRDIIAKRLKTSRYYAYRYDGFFAVIGSMKKYFSCNMMLLDPKVRGEALGVVNQPIYTKVRNSPPTRYITGAKVKNSIIADGCVIEGTVENSIVFRGVHIGKGTVIKNSILLQDTFIGDDVYLNCLITDKNVTIKDGKMLSGHETLPFYIGKETTV